LVAESEYGARHFPGAWRWLLLLLAGGWSVFQLLVVKVVDLNAIEVRCAHLAFGLILVFLCFPTFKRDGWLGRHLSRVPGLRALGRTDSPPWIDLLLGVTAAVVAMYYVLDAEGVAARQGAPSTRDLIAGGGLILLLLEAARRALGPALPIVALAFMGLSMVSESLGPVAWREADLEKVIGKVALTIEGILGKPLDVSANTVFLYVLFGAMLDKAGAGAWFIDLAFGLVGRMRGGAAKAAVLASGFTGIISGSSIANVVTTGTFTIPLMVRAGYPPVKAGAVEVAASTNGQLMPPIMGAAAFIIAEYTGLPFHQVVIAAALPAVLSYLALFYITHLEACRLNLAPVPKDQLPPVKATFMRGLPYLLPLGLLLYLLMIERISPQLAAFWAIMCLAGIMLIWRGADALRGGDRLLPALGVVTRDFGAALVQGGRNMMGIAVAVAAAGIIVGIVTLGLGGKIVLLPWPET
jgi:TRAP transporter 4TM/12TM fusion protein